MMPVTITQLRARATVDLMTAACALGLGRTKAYELAKHDEFPCRVIRIGDTYRVPTAGLLELLGVTAEEPRTAAAGARPACPARDHDTCHHELRRQEGEPGCASTSHHRQAASLTAATPRGCGARDLSAAIWWCGARTEALAPRHSLSG